MFLIMLGILLFLSKDFSFYHKRVQNIRINICNVILLCITTHFESVISVKQYDLGREIVTIFVVVDINVIKS